MSEKEKIPRFFQKKFFLTMFENYISKTIEKKTRLVRYLSKSLKTTIQPSSIKTFQHPIILTF